MMANEEEMESFEISEQDLYVAFHPGQRRGYRRTKNQQICGVFNEESDDEGPSSSDRYKKKLKTEDFTAPLSFVKGGVHQVGGTKKSKPQKARYFAGQSSAQSSNTGLADWEKHTTGIGSKLLMQMGYEPGKGLGKSLQGRCAPVEATVRKGRGAIGAYGAEHKSEAAKFVDSEDEEEKEFQKDLSQWRQDGGETKSRKKDKIGYAFRTKEYSEISKTKVIDMTGREPRVLSGYSALSARKTTEPEELNKLAYSLDALVGYCEHEVSQNAQELSRKQDEISALEDEIETMSSVVIRDEKQIGSLSSVLQLLEQMEALRKADQLDVDFLLEQFRHLERDDYIKYDMANVALTYLVPLVKDRLSTVWRPFESGDSSDENCRRMLLPWRSLLENQAKGNVMEPYDGLLWNGWMPALRGLIGQWRCKEAEPMVDLLDRWEPLLPGWIMDNILEQLILPRIQSEVDAWNPLTDLIPIHTWIHPWLPRLSDRLELVYPTIRHKMARALVNWQPSDQSARSILLPWVLVFSKGTMGAFLVKNILPKLEEALMSWTIHSDPHQQDWDVWKWIMQWKDLLPMPSLVTMLENCFFPKWLQVLVSLLNHEEINIWYKTWKTYFTPDIVQHPAIKEQFMQALMNRSVAAGNQASAIPPLPPAMLNPAVRLAELPVPQGFRELVEYRCVQQGILFVPLANRRQSGRPVFRVGNVLCYFDRHVAVVMSPNGVWVPVSTDTALVDMAVAP